MDIPAELLTLVCQSMNKAELKLARLICNSLNRAAVPLLFNEVFLSTNRADFEVARLNVQHFSPYLKTLTFSSVSYPAMSWTEYKRKVKSKRALGSAKAITENLDGHLRLGYQNHCRLRKEQEEDLESGVVFAQLCSTLQRSPSLQSIVLRDIGLCRPEDLRSRGLWSGDCLVQNCTYSKSQHLQYQLVPTSGFASATANPWHLVMLAMWATKSSVRNITIAVSQWGWPSIGLPTGAFALAVQRPYAINDVFQKLTRLNLSLYSKTTSDGRCFEEGCVARVLSIASNLTSLSINFSDEYKVISQLTRFQGCLGGCQLAKLKSLDLSGFNSTFEDLFQFLNFSPELEALHFYDHELKSGTWEAAANRIRASFKLNCVNLTYIYGGWTGAWAAQDLGYALYYNWAECVEAFFLNGGENPFSETALQRYVQESESYSSHDLYGGR